MITVDINELAAYQGMLIGHSPWVTLSQAMIDAFAEITGDHQWIHVDVDRASRESPWKSPVAHGYLTASLVPKLNSEVIRVTGISATINYGLNKLRFPTAVKAGSDIRSRVELISLKQIDDKRLLTTYQTVVEIRNEDKPACVLENLAMYVL